MESWVIYALLASVSWGVYIVISKLALDGKGSSPFLVALLMGFGIMGLFGILFLATRPALEMGAQGVGLAVAAGAVWALGQIFAIMALVNRAPVAKLAPLYNTNTLIAVLLGIILLKELPSGFEKVKVLIGAALIVIGGILVSS
ncbi:MAG: GRP family sugar transporter [Candidatus Diapherotrites archaeon]